MAHEEKWSDYLDAAHRKTDIARYHLEQLRASLAPSAQPGPSSYPPIPVQAHFEGVVVSVMAAVDQVAQGINVAFDLRASSSDLFEKAYRPLASTIPELDTWLKKKLGLDLRRIRVRIVHYSYRKKPVPGPSWHVEDTGAGYDGSRELRVYSEAALRHAEELIGLIKKIRSKFQR